MTLPDGRGQPKEKWVRVSRGSPCPICSKPDYCSISPDGEMVNCMRVESDKANRGRLGGWLHRLSQPIPARELIRRPEGPRPVIDWQARALWYAADAGQWVRELAVRIGVSEEALVALGVGHGSDDFGDHKAFWTFPERNLNLKVTGIVRRYRDGTKKTMQWSRSGLYLVREWWKADGPILLPEGGSDTSALLTMGLCGIGRPSNLGGVNLLIGALKGHRNRPIIVLAERDKKEARCEKCDGCGRCFPGKFGSERTAEALSKALKKKIEVRFCGAKDCRAWLNEQSTRTDLGARFLNSLRSKP